MKSIAKSAVLAMTLSLAFALSACGESASSSAASASASASSASASSAATSASASAASASSAATSASASSASTSAASASDAAANVYSNEYFKLNYDLPEGWTFANQAALNQANSPIASLAGSDEVDMVAMSSDGSTAVVVAVIEPNGQMAGKTAEDLLKTQTEELQKSLEGSSVSYTSTEGDVTFNGMTRTLPATFTTATADGKEISIGQAVAEKDGAFLDVLIAGPSEDAVAKAFEAFRATAE